MWRKLITCAILYLLLDVCVEVQGLNEFLNTKIAVTPPSASCAARANQRPCPKADGSPILAYPPNYPCPCYPADGGGAVPATGRASAPNTDLAQFVDELVIGGFNNPVSVAYTDNTNKAFVGTKQGQVWWVDLATKQVRMWIDLTDEVQNAGDRGLIGVVTNPNFAQNPYVFLSFTVDPVYGQPDEPENYAAIQRLIRLTDNNGATSDSTRMTLFGATAADAVYVCFNTHALGQVRFGLDGSLIIATGEGAHWDIPQGDYGQNFIPTDVQCDNLFFNPSEDVGAFRSQSLTSLGGKILRLDPLTGQGICPGATNAGRYTVMNPFCNGNPNSRTSKIWAMGFRQSWRMNVRPLMPGETLDGTPGAIYTAEVGEGGFEEINVVRSAGQNLGWPCWEGPLPMAKMRDSPLATDPNSNPNKVDPLHLNCKHIYENVTTTLPFYFWSRWGPNTGDYGENHYLGLGFTGNTAGGVGHYTGNLYPSKYKYTVWVLDFSQRWIRVLFKNQYDQFDSVQDFMTLGAPIASMEAEPVDGNMVYLNFGAGQLHMIRYLPQNVPPTPVGRAIPSVGATPLTVQFSSDGTFDRDGDATEIWWTFGDGTTSTTPNPAKVYTAAGQYTATLFVRSAGVTATQTFAIRVGPTVPVPRITQPSTLDRYAYTVGADITFSTTVAGGTAPYQYKWEINLVHLNHIHPDQYIGTTQTFTIPLSYIGADTHAGARINFYVVLTVTDAQGNIGKDFMFLTQNNFPATNALPVPVIAVSPSSVLQAGQPISITAQDSTDPDLDYLFYRWDWGDGTTLGAYDDNVIITSHTYATAGTYTIRLTLTDNFGATAQATRQITIGAGNPNPAPAPTPTPTPPPVTPPTPNTYVSTVPGVVQIESYMSGGAGVAYYDTTDANLGGAYRMTEGVDLEVADDVGGGYSLGYIEAGEWIKYQLTVTQAGTYAVQVRYAYPAGTPIATDRVVTLLLDDGTAPVATLTAAPSGGWGVWQTTTGVTLNVPLTAGTHQITVQFTNGWWRVNYLTFTLLAVTPVAAPVTPPITPPVATPVAAPVTAPVAAPVTAPVAAPVSPPTPPPNTIQLPGTVQAENYMPGGQGVAYYDTTPGNTGGVLRNDDVDIAVCTDGANCYSVDYLEQGEWLRYQVTFAQSGTYAVTARYAYPAGTPVTTARTLTLQLGTAALGTLNLAPATASWDTWATSAALNTAAVTAGTYQLTVTINQGWWRLNSLQFTLLTATPPPVTPVTPPIAAPVTPPVTPPVTVTPPVAAPVAAPVSPSYVTALPGVLQVENYRVGGQGVAYYDTTPGNSGGAYRTDDVDLQNTNGEIGIGYIESGEWLTYQVTINTAGTYRVQARYAYPPGTPVATNRQLRLFIDNSATPFVTLSLPPTGDWTTWAYSTGVQTLNLPAGSHVVMMRLDYGYWTLDALQFTLISAAANNNARRAVSAALEDSTGPALYFTADTFVSSASADQSSGTLPGLVVMSSERGTSVALLQLNVGAIDLAESARVRLFTPRDVTPVNVTCHLVTDPVTETLTWNNKITWSEAVIDSQLVSNAGYYEFDVTQLVQLTLAQGESALALAFTTSQGRVVFASKEHAEITARPALIGQSQARAEQITAESSQYMRDGPDVTALIPSTQLLVEGTAGTQSRAYVRYSIFNIPRKEVYRMRLFGAKIGTPGTCVTVRAYSADDSQWTDHSLAAQPQFGVMIASTVICDTEPRWNEWDISLYVRQQLTKDARAITIGLDVTPLSPELSQNDVYQSPERVVFDGVTHPASMPSLAFDVNLHDFVYSDEFVAANTNNDVFQESAPTATDGDQPTTAPTSTSAASLMQINAFILFVLCALIL